MGALRRIIAAGVFVLLLVSGWQFAARNAGLIDVDYLFGRAEGASAWLVLLAAFALGALLIAILSGLELIRARMLARRYRKEIGNLESEVHHLRNLPLSVEEMAEPVDDLDTRIDSPGRGT
jgi:uncharacterized integral membrane protein